MIHEFTLIVFSVDLQGTPQGGIISPTLANMTLDGMEKLIDLTGGITKYANDETKRNNKHKIHFVRYADDFIVTCDDREVLEKQVKPVITEFLKERGLILSEEKTKSVTSKMVLIFSVRISGNTIINYSQNLLRKVIKQ